MKSVTKTYGHNEGWSACFRQPSAESHCRFLHGYALSVELEYRCGDDEVDLRGWVIDFGGLKGVKQWLKDLFDHKTLVAADDPALHLFQDMNKEQGRGGKLADLVVLEDGVGCENFAKYVYQEVNKMIAEADWMRGVYLHRVTVREHEGNAASYIRPGGVK